MYKTISIVTVKMR